MSNMSSPKNEQACGREPTNNCTEDISKNARNSLVHYSEMRDEKKCKNKCDPLQTHHTATLMAVHLAFAVHFQHPPEQDGTRKSNS